ncbi:hypothetical protein PR202_ga25183 [Eleusine coracana subsp. coracana]|uniref:Glycosyltransferase n=1 Tax=Eleusine coracana subsp. coracana TaxID=191504 RepID=A0AAV5D9J6_ELECO|nr:hypothetical protein PR202_ga25183 [Eleusine coracana subsp. coracana]
MATATVVFVPYWASGHFMSMIEAGKRMLHAGGGALSLTVLVMQAPTPGKAAEVEEHVHREEASSGRLEVSFIRLPAVEPPTGCAGVEEFNFRYVELHAPRIAEAVAALTAVPVAAVVVDLFCTPLLDVASELAVPRYVYFASTAAFLALMLRLPALREEHSDVFEEMEKDGAAPVPGLPPVPRSHMPVCLSRTNYRWFEYYGRRFLDASGGVIVNSCAELERGVIAAIADGRCVPSRPGPAVHAIGPVIWFNGAREDDERRKHECVRWLDGQQRSTVVFLCFGSIGWMSTEQVAKVAAGLERSGHPFLWVLRGPPAGSSRYPTDADLNALLPDGFLALTEGKGLVWPTWAPQKEILAHGAVGGFVTHCGWNSVLESLWHGVPMVPWPLYGEQHLNAFELVAEMGVAVELEMADRDEQGKSIVEAAGLDKAVRGVMGETQEGRKAREKAAETMAACRKAVAEGGSSHAALRKLVREIAPDGVMQLPVARKWHAG